MKSNLITRLRHLLYYKTGFARRRLNDRFNSEKNILFIWIPKTAGTSLYDALCPFGLYNMHRVLEAKYVFPQRGFVTFNHVSYQELRKQEIVSKSFDDSSYKFCFVRNPYKRAISLFQYLYADQSIIGHPEPTFLQFCQTLQSGEVPPIGLYSVEGLNQCNPQFDWIKHVNMDFIGKVENLDQDIVQLQEALGLTELNIPHSNKSRAKKHPAELTPETISILNDFYREDFDEFGYDMMEP
ncbi:MAG: sulfotransferase family 2 domain-containing protein [Verrucomicrobiota bacterium]